MNSAAAAIDRLWHSRNPVALALWPLSLAFRLAVALRRLAYRRGVLKPRRLEVPVIVVGNITVGGSGKTPLVIRLAQLLREAGYRPGIVSRGYGGKATAQPQLVTAASDPAEVGDEPLLLARRSGCPVAVAADRVAAARTLLARHACNVILADDGLQHYRLGRDLEIAVIDGARRFGNGFFLPAGPLREPPGRLRQVDFRVANGAARPGEEPMTLLATRAVHLADAQVSCALAAFRGQLVHAVAGIGHPERFFQALQAQGIRVLPHPFPDHHPFTAADLDFADELPVLMTEKDAVKCQRLTQAGHFWQVPVQARLEGGFEQRLLARLAGLATTSSTPLRERHDG
ncbi:MAG: tetraacyldisaccharide 4'-kinase [Pseudomonadota bacterium]|nr:tetraacyldisaccharide 4'-kinase [Pseudomonadota bacterium]